MYISQVGNGIINSYPLNKKETKYSNKISFKNAPEPEKRSLI